MTESAKDGIGSRGRVASIDVVRGVIMIIMLTRWITYFCAPVFFLLTGTGAFLSLRRCFAYQFNIDYQVTMLLVLWALGWSMIALAVLVHLPTFVATAFGAVLILGHNLFDSVQSANPLWAFVVFAMYPLCRWFAALKQRRSDAWLSYL